MNKTDASSRPKHLEMIEVLLASAVEIVSAALRHVSIRSSISIIQGNNVD